MQARASEHAARGLVGSAGKGVEAGKGDAMAGEMRGYGTRQATHGDGVARARQDITTACRATRARPEADEAGVASDVTSQIDALCAHAGR